MGWVGLIMALTGVGCLAYRRKWALLGLTGLAYLASVAFNLFYTIGDIYVLFIPSYLLLILWMAVGAACLVTSLLSKPIAAALLVALLFALPLWAAASRYPDAGPEPEQASPYPLGGDPGRATASRRRACQQ